MQAEAETDAERAPPNTANSQIDAHRRQRDQECSRDKCDPRQLCTEHAHHRGHCSGLLEPAFDQRGETVGEPQGKPQRAATLITVSGETRTCPTFTDQLSSSVVSGSSRPKMLSAAIDQALRR